MVEKRSGEQRQVKRQREKKHRHNRQTIEEREKQRHRQD